MLDSDWSISTTLNCNCSPDQDSVEDLGHLEVVIGPERSCAEFFEVTVKNSSTVLVEVNISTFDPEICFEEN